MIKIAPSILGADPLNLERDVRKAEASGCDWLHVDVMDAHFVPNLAFSPDVVRGLRKITALPLDVHLMMDHPESMLEAFIRAGADRITIHTEIGPALPECLKQIRSAGLPAGLALRPGTPLDTVTPWLDQTDLVLAMTVEPGFGGQKLDEHVLGKIRALKAMGYPGEIEADGGIREDNLPLLVRQGLTVAVMGTALFGAEDMKASIRRLHDLCAGE